MQGLFQNSLYHFYRTLSPAKVASRFFANESLQMLTTDEVQTGLADLLATYPDEMSAYKAEVLLPSESL
jgi:hypothetical protein